jgi:hypothetical protein
MPLETEDANSVIYVSIGIFAWNEEDSIASTLESLFAQSFFAEAAARNFGCEVICVVNGCTDRTPEIATQCFEEHHRRRPEEACVECRVVSLSERGKLNAWNKFVHVLSARSSRFLVMMDADILIHRRETVWNMVCALEHNAEAHVSVDRPCKDLLFKRRHSIREKLSLAAGEMTTSAEAQLCAQLYCIRAEIARNIYLPKDLPACEDGFIKALVCTDFLRHPVMPERICLAPDAAHTFEAYTSPLAILKNQKRQIIGQTIVHILIDNHLKSIPARERQSLAATLSERDSIDPSWLKLLIKEHLHKARFFWRLYPDLLRHRFKALRKTKPITRLVGLPAALAGFVVTLISSIMAYSSLKAGTTDYWPQAKRLGLGPIGPGATMELTQQKSK